MQGPIYAGEGCGSDQLVTGLLDGPLRLEIYAVGGYDPIGRIETHESQSLLQRPISGVGGCHDLRWSFLTRYPAAG